MKQQSSLLQNECECECDFACECECECVSECECECECVCAKPHANMVIKKTCRVCANANATNANSNANANVNWRLLVRAVRCEIVSNTTTQTQAVQEDTTV